MSDNKGENDGREGGGRPATSPTLRAEDLDTARLVTRFQAGDREASFTALYQRYFDRVYGYLLVALNNVPDAEDAAQQVFTNALEALPAYERRRQPFRGWLFKIVRNCALDVHAQAGKLELLDPAELAQLRDEDTDGDQGLPVLDWLSDPDLLMFVERLPHPHRQVLVLRYMIGLKHREIARVLERSPADVRMLQSRAIAYLRKRLKSIGRGPTQHVPRAQMRASTRPSQVLRSRRFALDP